MFNLIKPVVAKQRHLFMKKVSLYIIYCKVNAPQFNKIVHDIVYCTWLLEISYIFAIQRAMQLHLIVSTPQTKINWYYLYFLMNGIGENI